MFERLRQKNRRKLLQRQELIQDERQKEILKEISDVRAKKKIREEFRSLAIFLGLLGLAVGGRVAMQWIPSVEPIIPIAIMAGVIFGVKEGFTLGGSAFIISNFFIWGMQGPWTIFQALGAAIAGGIGGVYGKMRKIGWKEFVVLGIIGTAIYEIIINISGGLMGIGLFFGLFSLPLYFAASIPFIVTHIVSNIGFSFGLSPLLKKLRRDKNEFKIINISKFIDGKRSDIRMYKSE
ncbi:MAG: hypothetical protein ABIE23_00750 [archaeon]|nr:hypothetical protein [Candidatus Micrarchaeota archaeon]